MTILIVDDSQIARNELQKHLQGLGRNILTAENGEEGVLTFQDNQDAICLILTDVNMPKLNGAEMAERIFKLSEGAPPPIVAITTEISVDLKQNMKQHGVKAWVVKPYQTESLLTLVKKLIG